ncbi:MAG TPA: FAD-binding protein [Anaerolineae bacterium]|nr:FAD-binding protein [Anaerolineae bacterium]
MRRQDTDVLVVGSGGAGLYAAIEAAATGAHVSIWDKGLVAKSGGTVGGAGLAAVGPWSVAGDGTDVHLSDTLHGGAFLNDQRLARILVEEAERRVVEMEGWGLRFDRRPDGHYVLDIAGGHTFPRLLAISDRVGLQMSKVLGRRLLGQVRIEQRSDILATRVLTRQGRAAGVMGIDLAAGEVVHMQAGAIVLATGGVGQLYPVTSNPVQCTGDGLALALGAGARLVNMEQVQFYPSGLVYPPSLRGFILGVQEYAKLYNGANERFMARYEPEVLEKTTRDRLARAIQAEIAAGRGSEHGGVCLDATTVPEETFRSFEHEYELCKKRGFDLRQVRMEVAPAAHYFMGGVEIDADGCSNVPGLLAAGEVAGGVQGGNRLSGNSLADIAVFGARAGASAARYACVAGRVAADAEQEVQEEARLLDLLRRGGGSLTAADGRQMLRELMWTGMGVVRNAGGLAATLAALDGMSADVLPRITIASTSLVHNRSMAAYLELEQMVLVAGTMARAALARRESRGAHFRDDHPVPSEAWPPSWTVVRQEGESLSVALNPLTDVQVRELSPEREP